MEWTWETFFVLGLVLVMLLLLAFERAPADFLLMGVALLSHLAGIITIKDVIIGFNNQGMLTVAVLFMVSLAVEQTGGISFIANSIFKGAHRLSGMTEVVLRLFVPVATVSAFLNNTPLVAMMMGATADFAYQVGIAPSKLLLLLSYAAILGGTCTTIGTSTNLVVTGFAERYYKEELDPPQRFEWGLFEIGKVGLPSLLAGVFFVATVGHRLIPARKGLAETLKNRRVYQVVFRVRPGGRAVGKSLEKAGIRGYSVRITQITSEGGRVTPEPKPDTVLQGGDLIYVAGTVEDFLGFAFIWGIEILDAGHEAADLGLLAPYQKLTEAVLAPNSVLVDGGTVGESTFRTRFSSGPLLGVHRNGELLQAARLADVALRAGDVLLFVAGPGFKKNDPAFATVWKVTNVKPIHRFRAPLAAAIALAMIISASALPTEKAGMFLCALVAAALLAITGCFTPAEGRASLNLEVLITVAAAFAVSEAMTKSKAAKLVATGLLRISTWAGEGGVVACIYLTTSMITEVITNNAAVAIMFPIAWQTALKYNYRFTRFIYALMMGGSASFITPIGYQTNMMVKDLGGYHFRDYQRVGSPLQFLVGGVTIGAAVFDKYWYLWAIGFGLLCVTVLPVLSIYEKRKLRREGPPALPPSDDPKTDTVVV